MRKKFISKLSLFICLVLFFPIFPSLPMTTTTNAATTSDFFSSFEADDAQITWESTVEIDPDGNKMSHGVIGEIPYDTIQGDITNKVERVTASANNPPNEIESNLIDQSPHTKWLAFESNAWIQFEFAEPQNVIKYAFTSANDAPGRDPKNWTMSGSNDGENWTDIDERTDQTFDNRYERKIYEFENDEQYTFYRFSITENSGDGLTQLAEVALSNGVDVPPPPPSDMKAYVGDGPSSSYTGKTNVGWTGTKALVYEGLHEAEGEGYSYNKVYDVDVEVESETQLSYYIHPQFMDQEELDYSSTYVSVDLAFTDGSYLSELGAEDQHGITLNPQVQGNSNTLYPNQWNYKLSDIGEVAAGKTIDRILIAYKNPHGPSVFKGSIDDIKIESNQVEETYDSPAEYVDILRGTNSNGTFSRGNNFPAVAVPHGFNFWTPVTDAGSTSWLYSYQQANNEDNLPELEAFSLSHETSPWMGDRQTFQVMPASGTNPSGDRDDRALAFKHENEIAKPYYYSVTFENGIKTEMTPTNRAAMFTFTFTDDTSNLIFDNVNNNGGLTLDADNQTITGYSDVRSGLSTGATRMFIYATVDKPVNESGMLTGEGRDNVLGFLQFDTSDEDKTVTMKIATSLISVEQAKKNLEQDIKADDTFEDLVANAKELWNEKLRIIEVEGATKDELVTLYSNMYRLFLYPNIAYENTGSQEDPEYQYASPFSDAVGQNTPTETGANIVEGKPYVNNGFWDTYRTTWPAYALLTPTQAGNMIDGFVQQYKDGGWISRWSSPGYANLMVGTSSDVAFGDAYLKGVTNFDVEAYYDSAIKNAAVASSDQSVGRKGLATSIFEGYTSTATGEGMSWAMDGYINDFAITNMAKALLESTDEDDPKNEQYQADYQYYLSRAQNYVEMFNPETEFFMGRTSSGDWRASAEEFNPAEWGGDYTETNAWNMAFHVPQDGQGLANLYGGRDQLANKLDEFFTTPETALYPGHYGGVIHEMREARDVRMGMYGHSNQPAHHIIYMYNYAGQPWKAQEKISEVMSRLYIGSEIGQGYSGDEDNGEMSAWYIFSAAGFYPLQMGLPEYAIGAPHFEEMTIHLENGEDLVIKAPNVSKTNKYVQSLQVNGEKYNKTTISHDLLVEGATIEFEMGPEPSDWGSSVDALPTSITDPATDGTSLQPDPLADLTNDSDGKSSHSDRGVADRLFDNNSGTKLTLDSDKPWVQYEFEDGMERATMYTITSGNDKESDPKSWIILGSRDGQEWTIVDKRQDEDFKWREFTKPFKMQNPGEYSYYRMEVTENGGSDTTQFAEIEFLGYKDVIGNFEHVHASFEEKRDAGDIRKPLSEQLENKFTQAVNQFEKDHFDQTIKKLNDFLTFLNKDSNEITEEAKESLRADVVALVHTVVNINTGGNPGKGQWKYDGEVVQVPIFDISELTGPTVEPGEDATVSVQVENIGMLAGEKELQFTFDGEAIGSETITLEPGEKEVVSFTVSNVELGLHQVTINELSGLVKALYDAPVLSLSFDNVEDSTVMDASPYGHDGTLHGNISLVDGIHGNALKLDGGYVAVESTELLNGHDEFTIALWVNLEDPSADQKIIGKTTIGNGYVLGVDDGLYPEVWNENGSRVSFNHGEIPANEWTHLVLTWKQNNQMVGYINGQEVISVDAGSMIVGPDNNPLIIGGAPWGPNGLQTIGLIDEVKLYKEALSTEQINQLYNTNTLN
ncbi:glycoside hydrolase family 92 protein [Ornithinibacillus sp. L9]|uniref:Glycoside hydrolase family 92 protein n=1 Tax=Ornithinibacillus caprae TaxID=2678566 RepID=A0A6N8FLY6_9BACI|nr:GH92 family glycosyl hydrolase [Ornithinibacillus caprae]MUK90650.1 glycoside hydrolase family 92 protein [Ornithinibacillus caprae]